MDPISEAVKLLEGKSHRLVWLPPVTLGYIYILSGNLLHFIIAVLSIGGTRIFSDILTSEWLQESDSIIEIWEGLSVNYISNLSSIGLFIHAIVALTYGIGTVYGIFLLNQFFTHTNAVIVGLTGLYCGIVVIIILNMSS